MLFGGINLNKHKNYFDLVIVGAGASGLMAAIHAHRQFQNHKIDARILLLDKNEKAGKKLLATGNGRCNLTNTVQSPDYYMTTHPSDYGSLIQDVLEQYSYKDVIQFFETSGMLTTDKGGYIYPRSLQAQTVVNHLQRQCEQLQITCNFSNTIEQIISKKAGYELITENGTRYYATALILAMGSGASVRDYNGNQLVKNLGLKIQPQLPALCGVIADYSKVAHTNMGKSFFKEVSGVRCEVRCQAFVNNRIVATEVGELQLTEYGLSGIVIFCLSRYLSRACNAKQTSAIYIDFFPDLSVDTLKNYLLQTADRCTTIFTALSGIMNHKLALGLIKILSGKYYRLQPDIPVLDLDEQVLTAFLSELKQFQVSIRDTNGLDKAQVCTGGVDLSELSGTLRVINQKHLYVCGELLDVDASCGGYNLQWAWASGKVAGVHAAEAIIKLKNAPQ